MTTAENSAIAQELASVARKRMDCCGRLIELQREQQAMLVEGRWGDLAENVRCNDAALAEMARLERRERQLAKRIETGNELRAVYGALGVQIEDAASRLRALVRVNDNLLRNAAEFVGFTVGVLAKVASTERSSGQSDGLAMMLDTTA